MRVELIKSYPALSYSVPVELFRRQDDVPENNELLATLVIKSASMDETTYDRQPLIDEAKAKAREIGGNAIKILQHERPSLPPARVPVGGAYYPHHSRHKMLIEIIRISE